MGFGPFVMANVKVWSGWWWPGLACGGPFQAEVWAKSGPFGVRRGPFWGPVLRD